MKKYWIGFYGWGNICAENEEEAQQKFWNFVSAIENDDEFNLTELSLDEIEEES